MNQTNDIEKQLRDAIASSGQSLNQLGQAAGVSDGQLSRFVRGERTLTLETVARLCKALELQFCPTVTTQPDAPPSAPKRPATGQKDGPTAAEGKPAAKRKKRPPRVP